MCDPDICDECRACNPVDTADCPGCLVKSKRLKCSCRESYECDFRYDGLPRNPEDFKITEKKEEYPPVHVMCGIRDILKELMEKLEQKESK